MNKNLYFLAVLSGILLALSFPPVPTFFFAFLGLVPLLYSINNPDIKRPYLLIYITFFIYHSGANWWIGSWTQDSDPYLTGSSIALAFIHPVYFMIPFAIFFMIRKKISNNIALLLFPFIWVSFEWFHNLGELSYPWLTLGNTQIYNHYWVQFIDITGVWGASLLIIFTNILLLKLLLNYKSIGKSEFLKSKNLKIISLGIFVIIILPIIYGYFRLKDFDEDKLYSERSVVKVGLIQPAINPWRKWEMSVDEMIHIQMKIADSLIFSNYKPDVVIWNETAIPRYIVAKDKYTYSFLNNWCDSRKTSIFTGFAELRYFNSKNKTATSRKDTTLEDSFYESYNSCLLINPNEVHSPQVYSKMRLTPMAERLPYSEYLMFMRSWFEWGVGISAWGIGTDQHNLQVKTTNDSAMLGPIICIESIYPEFVSNTTGNGAEIIVIITNDAWYDNTPGPEQHFLIAAMRAIENRRFIARCANTGVSGIISPTGKTMSRLSQYTRSGLSEPVPRLKEKSIYVLYGDWICKLSSVITILTFIYSLIKSKLF
jgi:apolipoprotein N-acyltransferase